jgi:hypothetical protein
VLHPATTVAMVTASTVWLLHDGNDEGFKTVLEINVLIAALAQEANGIDRCSEIVSLGTWPRWWPDEFLKCTLAILIRTLAHRRSDAGDEYLILVRFHG